MRVLFATDGEAHSARAAGLLERLADPARAQVHVLSVNGFELALREAESLGHYSVEAGWAHAQRAVDEAVTRLKAAGLDAEGAAIEDDEATGILRVADEVDAGLVVLGSGKERWLDVALLGSVSSSLLHASRRPVLIVHAEPDHDGDLRVLVGADGSEGAGRAIDTFAAVADTTRCAVTVISAATPTPLPAGGAAGVDSVGEVAPETLELARGHAERATETLREAGFRAEADVRTGPAARVLLDAIEAGPCDLAVVGARGLGRFRAKVLGSVSDRVVQRAHATLVGR
jgi:nucleotide-binding universal stress UspA family protein